MAPFADPVRILQLGTEVESGSSKSAVNHNIWDTGRKGRFRSGRSRIPAVINNASAFFVYVKDVDTFC
jgi:hypothetical protein